MALDGVSLTVASGTRLGIIGANGAGKTTMLSVVAGVLAPASGQVRVEGRVLPLLGASGAGLDAEASGVANVIEMGIMLGETPDSMVDRLDDIAGFSGLGGRLENPVYTYSSGMAARLRFSVITALRPDILVMDEGIGMADAEFTMRARDRLEEFYASAGIMLMASHAETLVLAQCDEGLWLHDGRIMAHGEVEHVVEAYRAYVTTGGVPG
jgi:ABC-type polysaccharide/polyol phosphate transport system ATPase subunit